MRHHKAGVFLAALIQASREGGRSVSADELVALWQQSAGGRAPDRTAVRRAVSAVQAGLDAVVPGGRSHLQVAPRCLTVGPWRLVPGPGEDWQVRGTEAVATARRPPQFTAALAPADWCAVASALAVADDLHRLELNADCAQLLRQQMDALPLSNEARGLWTLRLLRSLRKTGEHAAAHAVCRSAKALAAATTGPAGASMRAHLALVDARLSFVAAPHRASLSLDFERLQLAIESAPSAKLYWEWANLRALTLRRRIGALVEKRASKIAIQRLLDDAHLTFGSAYFWASLTEDAYHQQAIGSNYAYFLHWAHRQGLANSIDASAAWFRLAHTLVERFDLPQDSAWDFIMTADVYFENDALRRQIEADSLSWPAQKSPAEHAFYHQSIDLAKRSGDPRQQILALNQYARFLSMRAEVVPMQAAKRERDAIMEAAPGMVQEMFKDGFIPA